MRCPVCGGNPDYPMLVSMKPKAICAHEIHHPYLSLGLSGRSVWKYIKWVWFGIDPDRRLGMSIRLVDGRWGF